jgi:carboxyl-terminal processing protease
MTVFTPAPSTVDPPPADPASTTTPTASPARARSAGVRRLSKPAVLATAFIATFGVGVGIGRVDIPPAAASAAAPEASFQPGDEFALIQEAWKTIHEKYVAADELNDQELAWGAIGGLADAVGDTGHTDFMTPEEREARRGALSGSYVGIGTEVDTTEDGLPLIVGVFRNSPAEKAGIHAGDVILSVDDQPTAGESLDTVIDWIRGEDGTTVDLTVQSGQEAPVREVSVVRDDVHIDPVSWAMVPGTRIAVLRLEQFSTGAAEALHKALEAINESDAERLVLDLRGNPGGYVNEAVAIASEFLTEGDVYQERNAQGEVKAAAVKPGGLATKIPMVVLVDKGSASSAEIVSGAIQDAGRAKLVGETTFGTGTVLGEFELSDGSALRVGTVEWLTPKGRVIWHQGISPDVAVERPAETVPVVPDDLTSMTAAEAKEIADPQLARALRLVRQAGD